MSLINTSRRKFLRFSFALFLLPLTRLMGDTTPDEKETLTLHVSRDSVNHKITFMEDGELVEDRYIELCHIFKDERADVAVKMDPELFKILARGQQWLLKYGYNQALVITSAFRTLMTNLNTEGAAQNSMHIYGKAVDIKYPGLPIYYLASLFRTFGAAGIGIYPTFLHIDTWKERVWRG